MRRLSLAPLAALLGILLAAGALAPAASADVVVLVNGNILHGQLDGTTLPVETRDGAIQVSTGDLNEVHFNTLAGDVLRYRNGTMLTGWVAQPSYAVRLASGQTVAIEHSQLAIITFPRRR
jgi:hypothetical protein